MSCYYHPKVPTAGVCRDCGHEICATCSEDSVCPGCRLGRAMKNAGGERVLTAERPNAYRNAWQFPPGATQSVSAVAEAPPAEDRLLAALAYPIWPIALLMLFLPAHRTKFVRFHILQSLGVNALGVLLYGVYALLANLPVVGWQSALMLPFLLPIWFVVDIFLAVKAHSGAMTRVPIAAEYASKFA
jgi:uncharacterized membrane protein